MSKQRACVFIAGGTGYIGQRLIPRLLERGHPVRALARPGSEKKLAQNCTVVLGNALDATSYVHGILPADTFVQLVGIAHPSPAKSAEFRKVDLPADWPPSQPLSQRAFAILCTRAWRTRRR